MPDSVTIVGHMNWDACEDCAHYPPAEGGCKVDGYDNVDVDGDYVHCLSFEALEDEADALPEPNPDQLSLVES